MVVSHNIDKGHFSASVIKVHILLAVLNEVKKNNLSLKQNIKITKDITWDTNSIFHEQNSKSEKLETLLHFMIITSDNVATNVLIDLLGFDTINNYCKSIGLTSVKLNRFMNDSKAQERGIENYLSNADTLKTFELLYTKQILNNDLCDYALKVLSLQRLNNASLRYIWKDYVCYHKTGTLENHKLRNDCGIIVINNTPYYFGVLVQKAKDLISANKFIGGIVKQFVNYVESL